MIHQADIDKFFIKCYRAQELQQRGADKNETPVKKICFVKLIISIPPYDIEMPPNWERMQCGKDKRFEKKKSDRVYKCDNCEKIVHYSNRSISGGMRIRAQS